MVLVVLGCVSMNKMYIKRRHEEIKILNEYLKYNINMQVNSSFKDVYNLKMFLRNKLREKYFNYMDLTSMNSGDVVKENGIAYKFKYQRFDGQCIVDFEKNVIPVITDCKEQKTYWTTSGMGAITSLLCSIHLMKKYHFIYTKDIYFESIQLIERLHLNDMNIYNVVYLDSIQINFYECFSTLKDINAKFAILDSTCLDYKNEEMIIAELCRKFSACVVIKSHTKLDMLGTEFSQLGSITYYIGENIENTTSRYIKNIYELNIELIRHLGIFAKPFDIPVFWNHDDFIEINTRRISKIKECNTYAFNQMKLKTYKILKLPQHQLLHSALANGH